VFVGPVPFHVVGWFAAVTQKKLPQALTRSLLILFAVFSGAHQVAEGLMIGVGNPHRRKVAAR